MPIPKLHSPFVWFDLDDTLWDMTGNSDIALKILFDTDPAVRKAYGAAGLAVWRKVYHAVNHDLWLGYDNGSVSRDELRMERFARPLTMAGLSRKEAEEASRRLDRDYLLHLGDCPGCIEGAREAAQRVDAAGLPMGIVSNGFREVQYRKLRSAGMEGMFDPVVLSDDAGINKPARGFFDYACRTAGVRPEQCVVVGDNARTDIAGALAAGWGAAVWLDRGATDVPAGLRATLEGDPRCVRIEAMSELADALGI